MDRCLSSNKQHSMLFQGLSQYARLQLDRHIKELALQRVSDSVISTLESIFCFIKTDIPELYKPWTSSSSNHSTLIGAPLFILIGSDGDVLYTDDNKAAFITIDRHQLKLKLKMQNGNQLQD